MNTIHRIIGATALAFLATIGTIAVSEEAPQRRPDWRETAAKTLSTAEIEQLARDKILVTDRVFLQVFEAYSEKDLPPFITSDSLLNAFHVLFEETVIALEKGNAKSLPKLLQEILRCLPVAATNVSGKSDLTQAAMFRAKTVVGIALNLLGVPPDPSDPALAARIAEETARIEKAEGLYMPQWLGPAEPDFLGLDYARFKPRGFYTRTPELERYFRAISWLQAIPFRVGSDEELLSILLLAATIDPGYTTPPPPDTVSVDLQEILRCFDYLIGHPDDWDLRSATKWSARKLDLENKGLAKIREDIAKPVCVQGKNRNAWENAPRINDRLRIAPFDPTDPDEANYRIISAYRTPDAILFQRTTDPRQFRRPFPSGLEVAASLGSTFARDQLAASEPEALLKVIEELKPSFAMEGVYGDYLKCLSVLLAPPEADAPAFMSGLPWQRKNCQSALSGWSQLRHAFTLQAKEAFSFFGISFLDTGFVEPVPEFYSRLQLLAEEISLWLPSRPEFTVTQSIFVEISHSIPDLWRQMVILCSRLESLAHKQLRGVPFNDSDIETLDAYAAQLAEIMMHEGSAEAPNDVTPRIIDVFGNPERRARLLVGIARPRALYVLYPVKDREVFCRGAVVPYYEFTNPDPMTNDEWMDRLASDNLPPVPEWIAPIISGGSLRPFARQLSIYEEDPADPPAPDPESKNDPEA
jgi:hypothetical protein